MEVDQDLKRLTDYVRGLITGDSPRLDAIDRREMENLRRRPLASFLAELDAARLKIRGAGGNDVGDVLDLLASVMTQSDISKAELSRRSGVSRSHIIELFREGADPRPTIETTLRLAVGLEYPLAVVARDNLGDDVEVSVEGARRAERTYRDGFILGALIGAAGTAAAGVLVFLGLRSSKGGAR